MLFKMLVPSIDTLVLAILAVLSLELVDLLLVSRERLTNSFNFLSTLVVGLCAHPQALQLLYPEHVSFTELFTFKRRCLEFPNKFRKVIHTDAGTNA